MHHRESKSERDGTGSHSLLPLQAQDSLLFQWQMACMASQSNRERSHSTWHMRMDELDVVKDKDGDCIPPMTSPMTSQGVYWVEAGIPNAMTPSIPQAIRGRIASVCASVVRYHVIEN